MSRLLDCQLSQSALRIDGSPRPWHGGLGTLDALISATRPGLCLDPAFFALGGLDKERPLVAYPHLRATKRTARHPPVFIKGGKDYHCDHDHCGKSFKKHGGLVQHRWVWHRRSGFSLPRTNPRRRCQASDLSVTAIAGQHSNSLPRRRPERHHHRLERVLDVLHRGL